MNIRERLQAAYENVAYGADKTWVSNDHLYQKANLELYVREQQVLHSETVGLRPRNVNDCIPKSKLAKYSNYTYNESRELSYSSSYSKPENIRLSEKFKHDRIKEPWMLPEIDDLYEFFLYYQSMSENCHRCCGTIKRGQQEKVHLDTCFETPHFKTYCFEENALKMKIVSDRIKRLWIRNPSFYGWEPVTKDMTLLVYKTPGQNFFVDKYDEESKYNENHDWFRNESEENLDFEHLKELSKSFKEQTSWILNYSNITSQQNKKQDIEEVNYNSDLPEENPLVPSKRLYSAVLQGLSSNSKITSLRNEHHMTLLTKQTVDVINSEQVPIMETPQPPLSTTFQNKEPEIHPLVVNNADLVPNCSLHQEAPNNGSLDLGYIPTNIPPNPNVLHNIPPPAATLNNFQFTRYYGNGCNNPYNNNFQNNCLLSNSFQQFISNRSYQTLPRQNYVPANTYQFPSVIMFAPNRSSNLYQQSIPVPQTTHCFNPIYFTPNYVRTFSHSQRTYSTTIAPPPPPTNWILKSQHVSQNSTTDNQTGKNKMSILNSAQYKSKKRLQGNSTCSFCTNDAKKTIVCKRPTCSCSDIGGLITTTAAATSSKLLGTNNSKKGDNFEEIVTKTICAVFDEVKCESCVPINISVSDELEIQALEQYSNNNESDVFQELERQAAEQYEDYSENWKDPPKHKLFFGGFLVNTIFA